jgi:hypothetical protein
MGNGITSTNKNDIATFLAKAKAVTKARATTGTRGRLIFGLDATASRKEMWDMACGLTAEMFREVAAVGQLDVQLVYYRGSEFNASTWVSDASKLSAMMEGIDCRVGLTQIGRVLDHARNETQKTPVSAMVFVGDAMEEELDRLCGLASELGRLKVPVFMFQEQDVEGTFGDRVHSRQVEEAFREIVRLSGGAYCRFDAGAAEQLGALLRGVAAYAAGGLQALQGRKDAAAVALLTQMKVS